MANVQFKRGLLAQLPTTATDGVLYITTDEGAIYLGNGTEMKRLGDYVQVADVSSLPTSGANQNALYYAAAENVLARWNGTAWVQINAAGLTKIAVEGAGNAITGASVIKNAAGEKILTLTKGETFATQAAQDTIQENLSALTERVNNALGADGDGSVASQLAALKSEILGTGTIDSNYDTIAELATKLKAAESNITTNAGNITTNAGEISTLKETVASNKTAAETALATAKSDLEAKIAANTTAIEGNDADIAALQGRMTTAEGKITTLQNDLSAAKEDITDHETRLAAAEGQLETLIGDDADLSVREIANQELAAQLIAPGADESLNTLQEIAQWIQDHPGDAATMNAAISTNTGKITNLESRMTAVEGVAAQGVADAAAASAKVDTAVTNLVDGASAGYQTLGDIEAKVKAAQTQADKGVADAATAKGVADSALTKANTNAESISTNASNITKNADSITALTKTVSDNASAAASDLAAAKSELEGKITTNANNIAANTSNITKVTERVTTVEGLLTWGTF